MKRRTARIIFARPTTMTVTKNKGNEKSTNLSLFMNTIKITKVGKEKEKEKEK